MSKDSATIPGLNIQWPWSSLLLDGEKTIETRSYPLPPDKVNMTLAVIETPGPRGKREAGITKARIVGTITFTGCFRYDSKSAWLEDGNRHLVHPDDDQFGFRSDKEKWGWTVGVVKRMPSPVPAPKRRGIVFAKECSIG